MRDGCVAPIPAPPEATGIGCKALGTAGPPEDPMAVCSPGSNGGVPPELTVDM